MRNPSPVAPDRTRQSVNGGAIAVDDGGRPVMRAMIGGMLVALVLVGPAWAEFAESNSKGFACLRSDDAL